MLEEYIKLNDKEKMLFSKTINKLLNEKYITGEKPEDENYYYYIKTNIKLINEYLSVINMEVKVKENIKVIELIEENAKKLALSRLNSTILLILRLIYVQKLKELTLQNNVIATSKEIRDMYANFNFEEKLVNNKLLEALKIFKKYNIINFTGTDIKKDTFTITIYPTITSVINTNDVEELYNKIKEYKEVTNEEAYED